MDLSWKNITELARYQRSNPTPSEKALWEILRKRRLNNLRFVRQKPLVQWESNGIKGFYIADFYCAKYKLVIELDGRIHEYQKEYDFQRDRVLKGRGFKVLRIKNSELRSIDSVKNRIIEIVKA